MGNNDTKLTPTNILNRSYDPGLDVLVFEQIGADGVLKNPATEAKQDSIIENLQAIAGMNIPLHDTKVIDETDPNNITITYKLSGVDVAVKTIAISGTTTTISI